MFLSRDAARKGRWAARGSKPSHPFNAILSECFRMPDNSAPITGVTLLEWLRTSEAAADLLPENRTSMGHRILTNMGPHGTPEQWAAYLEMPRKKEPHLFHFGVYSPEVEQEMLRRMSPADKLEYAIKRGSKK
jgi:hypothetical protein